VISAVEDASAAEAASVVEEPSVAASAAVAAPARQRWCCGDCQDDIGRGRDTVRGSGQRRRW
jgi:hypothetical protein